MKGFVSAKKIIAASLLVFTAVTQAQEATDNSDIYTGVVNDPRGSIANSEYLTDEQKDELLATYDSANGKAVPACGTLLCMSAEFSGSECDGPIDKYFDIKKYRKSKFSPSRTAAARADYLDTCKAEDADKDKAEINAKFGTIPNRPF